MRPLAVALAIAAALWLSACDSGAAPAADDAARDGAAPAPASDSGASDSSVPRDAAIHDGSALDGGQGGSSGQGGGSGAGGASGGGHGGAATGGDAGQQAEKLALAFEEITLEGAPQAVTDFAFIPGTSELLMLEKGQGDGQFGGRVLHYELSGDEARLKGTFVVEAAYDFHDCGLISLAFDPDFATNRYVYFGYCDSFEYSTVSRHVFDPTDYARINDTATPIIRAGEDGAPNAWHNVGSIGFDADGNLWALFGEKNDPDRAQELHNFLGSVIRVRPRRGEGESGYEIVGTNPFVGRAESREEIVAYGLRSPWRGSMDSKGRLWIGDVGGESEEINLLASADGSSFGWPLHNGPCASGCGDVVDPVASWTNALDTWPALDDPDAEPTQRRSAWVGLEYQGGDRDRYQGRFDDRVLYGDWCGGWVRAIEVDALGDVVYDEHAGHLAGPTSFRQGPDGYVYATAYGSCFTAPYKPSKLVRAVLDE